jgi:hypothetical protein
MRIPTHFLEINRLLACNSRRWPGSRFQNSVGLLPPPSSRSSSKRRMKKEMDFFLWNNMHVPKTGSEISFS